MLLHLPLLLDKALSRLAGVAELGKDVESHLGKLQSQGNKPPGGELEIFLRAVVFFPPVRTGRQTRRNDLNPEWQCRCDLRQLLLSALHGVYA